MAIEQDLLAEIQALAAGPAEPQPLDFSDKAIGYARSFASGPLLTFNDELEAGLQTGVNSLLGREGTYQQNLGAIRQEQDVFKKNQGMLPAAVEVGSSFLNPLDKLYKLGTGVQGLKTITRAALNPASQAAIVGVGSAEGNENIAKEAGKSALFGGGFSALSNLFGRGLGGAAREADRLKLSAFGVKNADVARSLKKMGNQAEVLGEAGNVPILKILIKAEEQKLINAGDDVLTNISSLANKQSTLGTQLGDVLEGAKGKIKANPSFETPNSEAFISKLTGTAQDDATNAWVKEMDALQSQIGEGSIADLQRLKVGLNYKFGENPYKDDIVKALRSDLRLEIENRVNDAARDGKLKPDMFGKVKKLNQEFGELAELKDTFMRRAASDLGSDAIEDIYRAGATTMGTGTLNMAAMQGGGSGLLAGATSAALTAARGSEAKSAIADTLREFKKPLVIAGKALEEGGTARAFSQVYQNIKPENKPEAATPGTASVKTEDLQSLLDEIKLLSTPQQTPQPQEAQQMAIDPNLPKKEKIAIIEQQIDADPIDSTIYEMESSRNPKAKNPESTASGAFQLLKKTASSLGVKDVFDIEDNYNGYLKLKEEASQFAEEPFDYYAYHYLGGPTFRAWKQGKDLSSKQGSQVEYLLSTLKPRFDRIYSKKTGQVEA